ncbi:sigma factor-like helix-turn-helix DNA-binding protein [Chryseobacterium oryctis]
MKRLRFGEKLTLSEIAEKYNRSVE